MAPCLKAVSRIGQKAQHQNAREARRGDGQCNRRKVAGAQERDDKERDKENDCSSEILHKRQTRADHGGIGDEQHNIALCHQPRERGRADIDKADLDELRRLERHAAQLNPVARTEFFHAEEQVERQQTDARNSREIAHGLRPLQIAQRPADDEERAHARNDCQKLLDKAFRRGARHDGKAHRTQEKRQRLGLKARSAERTKREIQRPFQPDQPAEGGQLQRRLAAAEDELNSRQQLEQRQKQQRRHLMHGMAGPRAGPGLNALLLLCQGDERKIHAAHRNDVAEAQRGQRRLPPVDEHAGFGVRVRDRPAAVVVAR